MSFQLTILKVLVGHPDGRASLADLRHAVAILMSSGPDWTERMKRLALRVPDLDIFGSKLVSRDNAGWQITEAGREFLLSLETKPSAVRPPEPPTEVMPTPRRRHFSLSVPRGGGGSVAPEGPRIVRVAEVPHDLGWGGANRVQDRLRCVRQLGD